MSDVLPYTLLGLLSVLALLGPASAGTLTERRP